MYDYDEIGQLNTFNLFWNNLNHDNYEKINISATAAYRLGDNPLRTQTGQQRNADDDYKSVQFWLRGSVDF
jgi:hypothetical protein